MLKTEKICTKCGSLKSLIEFPAKKASKDGRSSWCRECYKISWKKRYYENHQHYRNSHNRSRKNIREQNARIVFEYLSENPCINCNESDPVVLEFDHREGTSKVENISNLVSNSSWEKVKIEIEKCDVLCANCHRRKSAKQFGYKRYIYVNM